MRTAIVVLVALGWLLGLAPAAHAKGPTTATIAGPGLADPVKIESYDATATLPGLSTLMDWTGGTVMFGDAVELSPDKPTVELGPRYAVTYYLDRQPVLTQELYPFTAKGPFTFTPAGQRSMFINAELQSGWYHGPKELATSLTLLGVTAPGTPQPAPAAASRAAPAPPAAPVDGGIPLGWWLVGALAAAGLAGGAVLLRRTVGVRR